MRAICGLTFASALACAPSYDPCFKPPSVVDDVRILAIRSDPPEALVDLEHGVVPRVQIRALVSSPGVHATSIQLVARVCIPTDDRLCPDNSPAVMGAPSGEGAGEAAMALDVPAELIAAARAADPLHGFGGTRVQLDLIAAVDSGAARASKSLLFSDAATTPAPNQPIEIGRVDLTHDGNPSATALQSMVVQMLVSDIYGVRPRLLPLPDGGSPAETYTTIDLTGNTVQLREQISYDFYAEPGILYGDLPIDGNTPIGVYIDGAGVADEPPPGTPDPPNGLVRATPMVGSTARVWVVARDSRGAQAWEWFDVNIGDERVCFTSTGLVCPVDMNCCIDPFIGCR